MFRPEYTPMINRQTPMYRAATFRVVIIMTTPAAENINGMTCRVRRIQREKRGSTYYVPDRILGPSGEPTKEENSKVPKEVARRL